MKLSVLLLLGAAGLAQTVEGPRAVACAPRAFAGHELCVCGFFAPPAPTQATIDGQTQAAVRSASARTLRVQLPENLAPGPHFVTVGPDRLDFLALTTQGSIDRNALLRGEATMLRLMVQGTAEPLPVRLTNRTPRIVTMEGGEDQVIETSGGPVNTLERRVRGIRRGEFQIDYELGTPACPCAGLQAVDPQSSETFLPRRVLAAITLAAPPAMLATAQGIAATHALAVVEVQPLASVNIGLAVFQILDALPLPAKVAALEADARVQFAQPDYVYRTAAHADPYAPLQYGPPMIHADRSAAQGAGVKIALIDTGVDTAHPDLKGASAERIDVTGEGWRAEPHGTLLAGILAATPDNGVGVYGLAPKAELLAIRACRALKPGTLDSECWSASLAKALEQAIQKGARVINLSLSGPREKLLPRLIHAAAAGGAIVVAAAGNGGLKGSPAFPAALDDVVAVTAVDAAAHLYEHATRGAYIDLAAPGVEIVSTAPDGRYLVFSGTSAAAAFVSGAVALLLERQKAIQPKELEQGARDLGPPGKDPQFGAGLVEACGFPCR